MYLILRKGYYHIEYFDIKLQKIRRKSTGAKNKSEALIFLTDIRGKLKAEQLLVKNVTLNSFFAEYTQRTEISATRDYNRSIKLSFKVMVKHFGDVPISSITNRQVELFLLSIFNNSKHAAYLYLRTLKAAFNVAIQWNYITVNPFNKIKLPKIPLKLPVFIDKANFNALMHLEPNETLQELYITAYYTGLRLGEITNLKWSDVFNVNYLIITNKSDFTTKSKRERRVPLNEVVKKIFLRRSRVGVLNDYIFYRTKGFRLEKDYVNKHFKKCVKKYDINSKYSFHTLRHSFASNLVQAGVSLYVVKELLGHSSIITTQQYSHLDSQSLEVAIKKLD